MNYPHIDVETFFTELVREYPMACVLTDIIPNPGFLNADFIFHHEKVVAELKRIEVDNVASPSNQAKINAVIDKFYNEGKIKAKDVGETNWTELPDELREAFYDITTRSIKGHVEKANKQIKETKEALNLQSYRGVLIIVNDGVESYHPAAFVYSIARLLRYHFSGITYFISFTANVTAMSREHNVPQHYWIGMDIEKDGKLGDALSIGLGNAWTGFIIRKTGLPTANVGMNDIEGFWKSRNLPK